MSNTVTTRTSSVSVPLFSTSRSNIRLTTSSPRTHPYVSTLTSMVILQFHFPLLRYCIPFPGSTQCVRGFHLQFQVFKPHRHLFLYIPSRSRLNHCNKSSFKRLFGQNFRFVLGGLSHCFKFQLFHTPWKFGSYHHTRETLKRVCLYTLLSP